jgi:hypothetical protein
MSKSIHWRRMAFMVLIAGVLTACSGGSGSSPTGTKSGSNVISIGNDPDGDGVEGTADLCPTVYGPAFNAGCPVHPNDADGDGTEDSSDHCPLVVGPASNGGCPLDPNDADGDGTPDSSDNCPLQPGPLTNQGCPVSPDDADGDGTPDSIDMCPIVAGSITNQGCPVNPPNDADGDGIDDIYDSCPYVPGPGTTDGCPTDDDGDGIPNADDHCPSQPGPASNYGCPVDTSDPDGDGVVGPDDECPLQPGPASNHGCPLNSEEYRTPNNTIVKLTTDGSGNTSFEITIGSTTYTGSYKTLKSGFDEFRCTGTPACRGYAVKLTDNVIVFWFTDLTNPLVATSIPVVAVVQGDCPLNPAKHNFVRLPTDLQKTTGWLPGDNGSGLSIMNIPLSFDLRNITFVPTYNGPWREDGFACMNGIIHSSAGTSVSNSSSGVQIRDDGPGAGGSLGLLRPIHSLGPLSNPGFLQSRLGNRYFRGVQWNNTTGEVQAIEGKYLQNGEMVEVDDITGNKPYECKDNLGCIVSKVVNPFTGVSQKKPFSRSFLSEFNEPEVHYNGLFRFAGTHGTGAIALNPIGIKGSYVMFESAKGPSEGNTPGHSFNAVQIEYKKK